VHNSLTKLECPVFQTGLSDFDNSNSAVSFVKFQNRLFTPHHLGDIKGLLPREGGEEGTMDCAKGHGVHKGDLLLL
jgi:hypothetical protein